MKYKQIGLLGNLYFENSQSVVACSKLCYRFHRFYFVDVGSWLKNLRLHKYGSLFSQLSYEEMLGLNEEYLESKVCMSY